MPHFCGHGCELPEDCQNHQRKFRCRWCGAVCWDNHPVYGTTGTIEEQVCYSMACEVLDRAHTS